VDKDRLSIAGYADTSPLEDNDTEQGRARNRRVDIIILNGMGVMGEPEKMPQSESQKPAAEPAKK